MLPMFPTGFDRRVDETVRRFSNEKWTRHTLDNAGIRATVFNGVVYVRNETDELRALSAIKANVGLHRMPVRIKTTN